MQAIPETRGSKSEYDLGSIKLHDSRFFPDKTIRNLTSAIAYFRKSNPDRHYTARTLTEEGVVGVRVWRIV